MVPLIRLAWCWLYPLLLFAPPPQEYRLLRLFVDRYKERHRRRHVGLKPRAWTSPTISPNEVNRCSGLLWAKQLPGSWKAEYIGYTCFWHIPLQDDSYCVGHNSPSLCSFIRWSLHMLVVLAQSKSCWSGSADHVYVVRYTDEKRFRWTSRPLCCWYSWLYDTSLDCTCSNQIQTWRWDHGEFYMPVGPVFLNRTCRRVMLTSPSLSYRDIHIYG